MSLFAAMNNKSAVPFYRIEVDKQTDLKINKIFKGQLDDFHNNYPSEIIFNAGYKPNSDECHILENFPEGNPFLDAVNRSSAIPKWDESVGLENVTALFLSPNYPNAPNIVAIQKFNKKQILETSSFLWLNKDTFSLKDSLGFSLDDRLVGVINGTKIKFKNFNNLRSIFDMNPYFSLATKQDLDNFTTHPSFEIPAGFVLDTVADNVIRTKVTLINKSGILNAQSVEKIKEAATKLNFPIKTSGTGDTEKIVMPSNKKEIKELLNFLDEDYFNSEITNKRYRSNSKTPA